MSEVLIVEDEFLVALDLEDILSNAGYTVLGVVADRNGVETVAHPPRIAFVDLNLRDGPTGADVARRLAQAFGTHIVFVTANPTQIDDPPPTAIGYVQKPFCAESILAAVEQAAAGARREPAEGLRLFH